MFFTADLRLFTLEKSAEKCESALTFAASNENFHARSMKIPVMRRKKYCG